MTSGMERENVPGLAETLMMANGRMAKPMEWGKKPMRTEKFMMVSGRMTSGMERENVPWLAETLTMESGKMARSMEEEKCCLPAVKLNMKDSGKMTRSTLPMMLFMMVSSRMIIFTVLK